jgi:PAS domain S-box-containing protein
MTLELAEQFDYRFIARARKFSVVAGIFVALVGAVVLAGWLLDITKFQSIYGDLTVKANTALLLILSGVSLCLLDLAPEKRTLRIVAEACAAVVALVAVLTLSQHLLGWNLGIDQLLFTEPRGALATTSPGRMGLPASTCFTLAGVALLLFHRRKAVRLPQVLSVFVCLWALLAIVGYLYQAEQLYLVAQYTAIALPTAVALFVLGLGLLAARVASGLTTVISSSNAGGATARRLLLTVVVGPLLLGWLRVLGQRLGYYDLGFGTALLILSIIIVFAIEIWRGAGRLSAAEKLSAEAALELKEKGEGLRRQASLIELSYDPIFTWQLDGGIVEWNKGCEHLYGYDRAEAMGKTSHDLLKTEVLSSSVDEYVNTLREVGQWSGVLKHKARDGHVVWVESRQQVAESEGKRLVLETNRDITEQLRGEESRLRLAAIVASSNDAIVAKTLEGIITNWNEGAQRIFGYTEEEVIGKSVSILIPPDRYDEEPAIIERLKRGERIDHYETIRVRKDGRKIDISLTISPIRNSLGQIVGASKIARDITESKRLQEEREALLRKEKSAREEAEMANRVKDEFVATVSHELRTPLNAILGWSSMLLGGKLKEADSRRALETIERNARSQAQLIEDILDISRSISGKLRLDMKPVELISVIRAAVDAVRPAAESKDIHLQLLLDPAADHVQADATRMQQIIWNLLSNAIKFTPKGGSVQVRLNRIASKAQVTVIDTGEGITAEFLPYVFNRFQQGDGTTTRRHGGLGLGLAIARHLVEMHGGTIEAASEGLGKGATFSVSIPILALRSATGSLLPLEAESRSQESDSNGKHAVNLKGLRILAVDDEADVRDMLQTLLEDCGANVLTAASAKEGLEALAGWKPHILISDIGMPEEDGYSLIRKVRALTAEEGADVPAIALTGYVRIEERVRALEAGYQMFVPKPVETNELISIIGDLCLRN